jgi:hypothetical protein
MCATFRSPCIYIYIYILYRVEPSIGKGSVNIFPAATDTHATTVLYSVRAKGYKEENWGNLVNSVPESVRKRDNWKGAAMQRGLERGI